MYCEQDIRGWMSDATMFSAGQPSSAALRLSVPTSQGDKEYALVSARALCGGRCLEIRTTAADVEEDSTLALFP